MKKVFLSAVVLAVALTLAANGEEAPVLAKVGDKKITMADLKRIITYYDPNQQKLIEQNPQYKASLLKRLVQSIVISKIARDNGLDKDSDVKMRLDVITDEFLAAEYLKRNILPKVSISEEDILQYYKAHQDEFRTPETVSARHILIRVNQSASEEDKKEARKKAEDILKRIKAGEDFATLASEFSDDPGSKTKGGDLGYFQRGRMVKPFGDAAFALTPGSVSDIVETQFGFHIIKVEDKKEAVLEPYEKVKDKVKDKLYIDMRKSKVEEFVENAMKDAGAELYLDQLTPKN